MWLRDFLEAIDTHGQWQPATPRQRTLEVKLDLAAGDETIATGAHAAVALAGV